LRVVGFALTIAGAALLLLTLMHAAPGDAIDQLPNGDALRPVLEREWLLDRPLWEQVLAHFSRAAQGDLGVSLVVRPGATVLEVMSAPLLRSATWVAASIALSLAWGATLAAATSRRSRAAGRFVEIASVPPVFLVAHLAVNGLNAGAWRLMQADLITRPSWFALPDEASWLRTTLAIVVLALGSGALSRTHLAVRTALLELRHASFIDAARARGEDTRPLIARHLIDAARARGEDTRPLIARHLIAPLAHLTAERVAAHVAGLIILERVLLLNGAGSLFWRASLERDWPLALGLALAAATGVAATRLACDGVRVLADPREREVSG